MITHYRSVSLQTGLLAAALLTTVVSAQNVGIGTTTPKSKLSVNGSTGTGGLAVGDATYTSTTGIVAPANGALIQGRVGIGTTSPTARLALEGDGSVSNDSTILVKSTAAAPVSRILFQASDTTALAVNTTYGQVLFQGLTGGNNSNATGFDVVHRGLSGGGPLTAMRFFTAGGTGQSERMRIDEDGNVGIADTSPTEARLVVRGLTSGSIGANRQFTQTNTGLIADAGLAMGFSIYASNAIVAEGNVVAGNAIIAAASVTPSDERLKNVIGTSDSAADLATLGKIRVTDYTMKDPSVLGNGTIKKVVAQQVEDVFPAAVSRGSGYLPDVYASARASALGEGRFEIRLDKPHGLEAGAQVKLFGASGEAEYITLDTVQPNSFTAKLERVSDGDKVFVFGRKVSDLRTVDYDALSMLNVSATQELAKKNLAQEARIAALEAENRQLKEKMAAVDTITVRLEAMEKALSITPSTPAESVSTTR